MYIFASAKTVSPGPEQSALACAPQVALHFLGDVKLGQALMLMLAAVQAIKAKHEAEQKKKEKKAAMARPTRASSNPSMDSAAAGKAEQHPGKRSFQLHAMGSGPDGIQVCAQMVVQGSAVCTAWVDA